MSIIIALMIVTFVWHAAMVIARSTVDAIATALGVVLFARAARVQRHMIATRGEIGTADFDRRTSRAERRLMAAGLKLAIRKTELRSLFPHVGSRCERLLGLATSSP
ncbi:hypothetical protein [uncultured Sphingomonas sp.]|uniref:hypothetical protein n=1 Tax=uncultured Sphingomonas sp. TaxID=158754 RepID=UPI0035CC7A6C